jgi:3-deoxy-D-manno-octulosonic-acid transferase
MQFLYNLSIYLYLFAIKIASLFNAKAKLWSSGRSENFDKIKSAINNQQSLLIWFHCASLGEFEQARPLIEKYKTQNPTHKILLTFFSPSGYEIRKNYAFADYIFYLPIDTSANAKKFIELIKPKLVFFVKYEFWFNYLNELKRKNIPVYLVSGIFRENHYFFKWYSAWFRKQLNCFTHFYLQDEKSVELINAIGYINATVTGDTRFDRVADIAKNVKSFPLIEQFKQEKKVLICGSTWKEDEKIISDCSLHIADYKLIIAPHEIDDTRINSIIQLFSNSTIVRYSQANPENVKTADILIIDNIGMLSSLYQYGTIAYIGGGFGKGIHNILEAATFGLPVIFGSNYYKFNEAKELIHLGGAFSISNNEDFEATVKLLGDKMVLQTASHIAKYYVQSRVGATDKILNSISLS